MRQLLVTCFQSSMLPRRQLFKKLGMSTLALSGVGLLSGLTGCGRQENRSVIRLGVTARPRMLDPRKATDALSSRVNRLIYQQLIDFDEQFKPVPALADWQQLSDTHYRFQLKQVSQFHNGQILTAKDVAATYNSMLDVDFGSPHRGSLKGIQRIEVVDERHVDFHLSEADPLFVGRLVIGILPHNLIEQNHVFHAHPIGSGQARFVSMSEQKLVLQRQDNTYLEMIPVKDATVRILKLRKGELDLVQNDLSPELVQYADQQPELAVDWQNGTNFGYIGFNFEDELLAQLKVRQAIAMGINREAVIDAMFAGHARLAGGLLVPEHWSGHADLTGFAYDPERAKSLLASADIPESFKTEDGMIRLSFKTSNDPTRIRLATIYQSQLREIGIDLQIQSYDWGTFYNDIKQGRFQLYSLAWVGIKSPDIFQYVFHSEAIPPKGANRGRYRDEYADELIETGLLKKSLPEQAKVYRTLQQHLETTLAAMPLWYEDQYVVRRQSISGYPLYNDGRLDGLLTASKQTFVSEVS